MLIGSYGSLYRLQSIYNSSSNQLKSLSEALGVGSASDDSGSFLLNSRLSSNSSSISAVLQNIQTGMTYTQLAQDSYSDVLSQLQTARTVAVQASEDYVPEVTRDEYNLQMEDATQSIQAIKDNATMNGIKVFGDGEVGAVQTYIQPTVLSGANDYVNISTNADLSTVEVRNSAGSIISHTVDTAHQADGYYRIDFTGTDATVSYDSTETITTNSFDVKEVTSGTTTAGTTQVLSADNYAVLSTNVDVASIVVTDNLGNVIEHTTDTTTGDKGYYTVNFNGTEDATVTFDTTGTITDNIYTIKEITAGEGAPGPVGYTVIYDQDDLMNLGAGENAILANDISLDNSFTQVAGGAAYSGIFDGNGFTITDNHTGTRDTELFDSIANTTVKNVTLDSFTVNGATAQAVVASSAGYTQFENISITNSSISAYSIASTGFIAGTMGFSGITNCSISNSTISAAQGSKVGGMVGDMTASGIVDSEITGLTMTFGESSARIGGMVGEMDNDSGPANITNSKVQGTMTLHGASFVGGLAGYFNTAAIEDSLADVDITDDGNADGTSTSSQLGGLVGYSYQGSILNSAAAGDLNIVGVTYVGGFVGQTNMTAITGSHSSGTIAKTGDTYSTNGVGGFIGGNYNANISTSYSTSTITNDFTSQVVGNVGGFVGYTQGTSDIGNCFYNGSMSLSNIKEHIGGFVGYSSLSSGGEITDSYSQGSLVLSVNSSGDSVGGFVGEHDGSGNISHSYSGTNIVVNSNVDMLGGFAGVVDANISNAQSIGTIQVFGHARYSGGFIGQMDGGLVEYSRSLNATGMSISTGWAVGGFVGQVENGASIIDAYGGMDVASTGSVSYIGGFAGLNMGDIEYSYANKNISVSSGTMEYGGGFAGQNSGTIRYSKADVGIYGAATFDTVGGFIGLNFGTISQSRAIVDIANTGDGLNHQNIGGFAGSANLGNINNSYVTGSIDFADSTVTDIGGFAGYYYYDFGSGCTLSDSYASVADIETEGSFTNMGQFIGRRRGFTNISGAVARSGTAVGYGSTNGITTLSLLQIQSGAAPISSWSSAIWNYGSSAPTLKNVIESSPVSFDSSGTGTATTTIDPSGTGATMTRTWDSNYSAGVEAHVNYYTTTDEVSITDDITNAIEESKFGDTDFLIGSLVVTNDSGLLNASDYDWYIKEGEDQYTLKILNASYLGDDLTVHMTGSRADANEVTFSEATTTPDSSSMSTYSQESDLVSISEGFLSSTSKYDFADDFYISDLTLSDAGTTYERGVHYDYYRLDGADNYTLEILDDSLLNKSLQLDFTGASSLLNEVSYEGRTEGSVQFDATQSIVLQVGITGNASDQFEISSFRMDLSELDMDVSNSVAAQNTVDMIDDAIEYIQNQQGVASTQNEVLERLYSRQEANKLSCDENIKTIEDSKEAQIQQEFFQQQLNYQTSLQMINMLNEMNYDNFTRLLDPDYNDGLGLYGSYITTNTSRDFINPLGTILQ